MNFVTLAVSFCAQSSNEDTAANGAQCSTLARRCVPGFVYRALLRGKGERFCYNLAEGTTAKKKGTTAIAYVTKYVPG